MREKRARGEVKVILECLVYIFFTEKTIQPNFKSLIVVPILRSYYRRTKTETGTEIYYRCH